MDCLRIKNAEIPANQLGSYGCTTSLEEKTVASETIIDGLERFFDKARKYAKTHSAPYVQVQDLKIKGYHTFDINGSARLYWWNKNGKIL